MYLFLIKRCQLPYYINDTYEVTGETHQELINKYIPLNKDGSFDRCWVKYDKSEIDTIIDYDDDFDRFKYPNFTLRHCNKWVYSKQYHQETIVTKVIYCGNILILIFYFFLKFLLF
jgi:hypothetical protein